MRLGVSVGVLDVTGNAISMSSGRVEAVSVELYCQSAVLAARGSHRNAV